MQTCIAKEAMNRVSGKTPIGKPIGLTLRPRTRAILFIAAWLPAIIGSCLFLPVASDLFARIARDTERIPMAVKLLEWAASLNQGLLLLLSLVFLGLLISLDTAVAKWSRRTNRERYYSFWFVGVLVAGVVALHAVPAVACVPLWMLSGREHSIERADKAAIHDDVASHPFYMDRVSYRRYPHGRD